MTKEKYEQAKALIEATRRDLINVGEKIALLKKDYDIVAVVSSELKLSVTLKM